MKLSSLSKKLFSLFISIFFCSTLFSEEGIDIWKKENLNKKKILVKNEDTSLKKKKIKY